MAVAGCPEAGTELGEDGLQEGTQPPGLNLFANWGELRVKVESAAARLAAATAGSTKLSLRLVSANPARAQMTFRFAVPAPGPVRLAIYDVQGRRVTTVLDQALPAGWGSATWDGRDLRGVSVASATYFARLESGGEVQLRKVLVAR